MSGFDRLRRRARWSLRLAGRRGRDRLAVIPLTEAVDALGDTAWADLGVVDVPVDRVVGTAARPGDVDRLMRPLRRHLRRRWEAVAAAASSGIDLPPLDVVQLGELLFVVDGHHRVSVARATGVARLPARVRRVCTVAYACHCLTVLDLPGKAAERRFLERYPLPDDVRPWLWLDDPAGWERVEAAASEWVGLQRARGSPLSTTELVESWWVREVLPSAHRCRPRDAPDVADYLCALRQRDASGCCTP